MSNQQTYNQHRANGVPHDEAIAALGVSQDAARMLKSRYNKAGNESPKPKSANVANIAPTLRQTSDVSVKRPNLPRVESTPKKQQIRRFLLYALLIAPTAASVQNAYHVGTQIMGDYFGAVCLTVVLSVTALGFVAAGVRNWYTIPLALLLIGYESFCNLTRIYAGLMIGGKWGTSEFLGRVCDVFDSGSHYAAVTLGGFTALLLAGVQYASIFELNKN